MIHVTVLFKSGGVIEFDAASLVYHKSTEEETYDQIVGYEISTTGTHTSHVYLDVKDIDALIGVSDEALTENE